MVGVADDIYREKGKAAIVRLVNAMKKLERVKVSKGRITNKPPAFKQLKPAKHHIWEYKSGELRFYFYLDAKEETLILIGYSTKDRQRDVIEQIAKKIPAIRDLLQQIHRKVLSNDSEQ